MAGKRIDDHSFWAGGPSKDCVLPKEVRVKQEMSAGGEGDLRYYEDTTEAIRKQQELAAKKVTTHGRKDLERN